MDIDATNHSNHELHTQGGGLEKASEKEDASCNEEPPKKLDTQLGNAFGEGESAKQSKPQNDWRPCLKRYQHIERRRGKTYLLLTALFPPFLTLFPLRLVCELNSHANACALGSCLPRIPYNSDAFDAGENIPIVTAATAYRDPSDGQVYILLIHEGLWFGDWLVHSIISPNQLQICRGDCQ